MHLDYRIEGELYHGKRFEYSVFYQPASPNSVTAAAHIQESVEFIYVICGVYTAFVNQTKYTLYPGDLLLILSRDIHSLYSNNSKENGYYVLKLDPFMLYNQLDDSPYKYIIPFKLNKENKRILWRSDELKHSEIQRVLDNIINSKKTMEYAFELNIKINCMQLLLCVLKEWNESGAEDYDAVNDLTTSVYSAIDYIHKNYMFDITAMTCAQKIGLSYSYFSRKFRKIIGKSFREYLNYVRCNEAEKLLLTTDKSVADIAFECGYNDICYFISIFKSSRGFPPNKYRNELIPKKSNE